MTTTGRAAFAGAGRGWGEEPLELGVADGDPGVVSIAAAGAEAQHRAKVSAGKVREMLTIVSS